MSTQKRKKFSLYCDYLEQFRMMSDEDAGSLIKAIFEYANESLTLPALAPVPEMAFSFICSEMEEGGE